MNLFEMTKQIVREHAKDNHGIGLDWPVCQICGEELSRFDIKERLHWGEAVTECLECEFKEAGRV